MAKRSVPNLAQRVHPPEDNKMNKNDLKRILNKLTAAANPEESFAIYPESVLDDPCHHLGNLNFFLDTYRSLRLLSRQDRMDGDPAWRVIAHSFMNWMNLFCLCKKNPQGYLSSRPHTNYAEESAEVIKELDMNFDLARPWWSSIGLSPSQSEDRLNFWNFRKKILKRLFNKCRELILNRLSDPDKKSCDEIDYFTDDLTEEEYAQLSDSLDEQEYGLLVMMEGEDLAFLSPANDPVEVTPCVPVPVEQIETAFSNIPSIVTMGLVAAGVLGVAFWIRRGNFTKAMAAASAIAVTSGASAAETQALNNALRGIAGPVMRQAANGQTFCPEPGTADTSSGG